MKAINIAFAITSTVGILLWIFMPLLPKDFTTSLWFRLVMSFAIGAMYGGALSKFLAN